jgi:competence ComEA-like helix-hairpin-helix protein
MASLDSSVPCTVNERRRVMSYLVILAALLSLLATSSGPVGAAPPHGEPSAAAAVESKVNINTADVKELMKLPGVGRSLAEKIVQYRDAHGPFKKAGDFRKVEGVGDGLWEKNRERIVIK